VSATTITLDTPIKRGETQISTVTLRRPAAGELRGLKVADLLQMDVDANIRLLPRISDPTLTEAEAAGLDPADLTQIAAAVAGFFLPKSAPG
jgi:hypothetical protein